MKLVAIERKILAGVAVAFVASLVVGIALYRSATEVILTEQGVEHTTQVQDGLDDLLRSFVDLNSAWIGYHLTRGEGFFPRLGEFKGSISSQLDKIRGTDGGQRRTAAENRSASLRH